MLLTGVMTIGVGYSMLDWKQFAAKTTPTPIAQKNKPEPPAPQPTPEDKPQTPQVETKIIDSPLPELKIKDDETLTVDKEITQPVPDLVQQEEMITLKVREGDTFSSILILLHL